MSTATSTTITPAPHIRGRITVPGDKSISHRYALVGALAQGRSRFTNFAPGADCRSTLSCLRRLGVAIEEDGPGAVTLLGRGLGRLGSPTEVLDAGNSGTTMRLFAGVLAGHPFVSRLIGDNSLSRRPMRRVIEPLERMGGHIEATNGHAPLTIHGRSLHGILYRPAVPSAQVKSAVLLAGLHAAGTTTVLEPAQTRDHTERALRAFGGVVETSADDSAGAKAISLSGGQMLTPQQLPVPGDFSSAAFWMVGAAARPGSRVEIHDVGLNPTRTALVDVLRRFGARVDVHVDAAPGDEPRGTIVVEGDRTGALAIGSDEVPALIDELPAIAALAAHGGEVTVGGATELRVKESDRISALVAGFRALGIAAEERPDGFFVHGGRQPAGGVADARGDHRMAMAFAIAALAAAKPSTIVGADSVVISYPSFFDTLDRLVA